MFPYIKWLRMCKSFYMHVYSCMYGTYQLHIIWSAIFAYFSHQYVRQLGKKSQNIPSIVILIKQQIVCDHQHFDLHSQSHQNITDPIVPHHNSFHKWYILPLCHYNIIHSLQCCYTHMYRVWPYELMYWPQACYCSSNKEILPRTIGIKNYNMCTYVTLMHACSNN